MESKAGARAEIQNSSGVAAAATGGGGKLQRKIFDLRGRIVIAWVRVVVIGRYRWDYRSLFVCVIWFSKFAL